MMHKILYLSRYFPPEISGGSRRADAMVKALRARGFVVKLGGPLGVQDDDFIAAKHPIFPANQGGGPKPKPSFGNKIGNFLRKNLLLPDPEIRWALRLVGEIKRSGFVPDFIIASGPPESLYVAGELLRRYFHCKLVFDMRDPWISPPQRMELLNNPIRKLIETTIAKIVFAKANGIIAVSEKVLQDGLRVAPKSIKTKIIGHFAQEFAGEKANLTRETFNLVHTGAISLSNPLSEFEPMLHEFEVIAALRKDLKLWFVGHLNEFEIRLINQSAAKEQIEIIGPVSMEKARALQMAADALLIVSGKKSHALPGKYAEYSMCNKPIILSQKGDWVRLLPQTAKFFDFSDVLNFKKGMAASYPHENAKNAANQLIEFLTEI